MYLQRQPKSEIFSYIRNYQYLQITHTKNIKIHGVAGPRRSRPMRRTSELFTGSTTVKLINALNKLP